MQSLLERRQRKEVAGLAATSLGGKDGGGGGLGGSNGVSLKEINRYMVRGRHPIASLLPCLTHHYRVERAAAL